MLEGHEQELWLHTSHLLAQIWDVSRSVRQIFAEKPIPGLTAKDFNPFTMTKRKKKAGLTMGRQLRAMATAFKV
jgi:hypothetical protein